MALKKQSTKSNPKTKAEGIAEDERQGGQGQREQGQKCWEGWSIEEIL